MGLWTKLRNTFRREPVSQDAADELAWHHEQRMQEYLACGMSIEDARCAAAKRVGNATLLAEDAAEADVILWLESLKRDTRLALRILRRTPAVSAIAIVSLALGIGANTVVFTLMKQLMLDYLPVPDPQQLVIVHSQEPEEGHTHGNGMHSSFSYPLYRDLNAACTRVFEGILAFQKSDISLTGREQTETVHGAVVSGNFFQVLHVRPWRGRLFTAADDETPGAHPVAVLSYGLWQRSFGGDPGVVNRTVLVNRHPYVVVGIAPPQFYGIDVSERTDLFVPIAMKADILPGKWALMDRLDHWCSLMGRLRPGVSAGQAAAALSVIYPPLRDQDFAFIKSPSAAFRREFTKKKIELSAGGQGYAELRDQFRNSLRILMAMVGLVLLITVVNIANLLVARGVARRREMAIRISMGAGKVTLGRQLIVESLLLALLGGWLGVVLGYVLTPVVLRIFGIDLSAASIAAHPDAGVLLFASGVTIAAGLGFGLLPALQSLRTDISAALKSESAWGHTGESVWVRRALVVGQMALSLTLITAAILFSRSLQNAKNIPAGFNTAHLVTFEVNPLQAGYSQERIKRFGEALRHQLRTTPGTDGAAVATVPLLVDSGEGGDVTVESAPVRNPAENTHNEYLRNAVSADFFSTMQIPLRAGRVFLQSDSQPSSKVAVVNETFVKRYLPGKNPIGMHFGFGTGNAVKLDQRIVGVVGNSKHTTMRSEISPFIYMPYLAEDHLSSLTYYVRVGPGLEQQVMREIRALVRRMDAGLPVNRLMTMEQIVNESLFVERSLGFLSMGFAVLATLLAIVGLYGVMAYSVTRRYREIGIRMAIGATPERVLGMVLRESAYLGIAGVMFAIPCVMATGIYIRSALYGVQPNDPAVWLGAGALLVGVALLAGFVPAWRAAHIDPAAALRTE